MAELRHETKWASYVVAASLEGVFVHPHNCVGDPETHDLDLERDAAIFAAVKVILAADQDRLGLWRLVSDRESSWSDSALTGRWEVTLLPHARAGVIRHRLPRLLANLERAGIASVAADEQAPDADPSGARRLGVAAAHHHGSASPGIISLSIRRPEEHAADVPADAGELLRDWVSAWIREPEQSTAVASLRRSDAPERHLFVILPGFTTAPSSVVDLLTREQPPLPSTAPDLPDNVTHLWIISTWAAGMGMRWAPGEGWSHVHKISAPEG